MYLSENRLVGARQTVGVEPTEYGPVDGLGQLIPESLIDSLVDKLITKSDPKVRQILSEEKIKLMDAVKPSIPFLGVSAVSLLATLFLVPSTKPILKFIGFSASSGAFLIGLYEVADNIQALSAQKAGVKK